MLSSTALPVLPAAAQWENLNPGAGGRIQDVVLDPNTPGRAYYMSDMEGASRTDDFGESWTFLGRDIAYPNTLTAAVEPGNADRVYLGTLGGLEISDDAGETWRSAGGIEDPITAIVVNPKNTDEVFAIPGNKMRWRYDPIKHEANPFGRRILYVSRDRGQKWEEVAFDPGQGRRDTFTLDLDGSDPATMVLSALAGIFRSTDGGRTWEKLPDPDDTGDSWGAGLSPDGRHLYACYQVSSGGERIRRATGMKEPDAVPTKLFATPTDRIRWQEVEGLPSAVAGGQDGKLKQFWNPVVDPRSRAGRHDVLVSSIGDRSGLWQIQAAWNGARLTRSNWERIFYYGGFGQGADFDHGWEQYSTRPLSWQYTPESWGEDGIWTTGDQTLFRVRREGRNWEQEWTPLYTQFVKELDGQRFYASRGVQCTFVFEGTGEKNYVVQANADNAIKESYDGGKSWAVGIVKPRSNAVTIVRAADPPIVLAHISAGYGAASASGSLYAKRLEHVSPKDQWAEIAGGPSRRGGLPDSLYNQVVVDPHDPKRVFIGTEDRGTFVIDDIEAFVEQQGKGATQARGIGGNAGDDVSGAELAAPVRVVDKGQGLAVDPHVEGRIWVGDGDRLWVADESSAGDWRWRMVREGVKQLTAWDLGGTTALAVVEDGAGGDDALAISLDGGETWPHRVGFREDFLPLRDASWYRPDLYTMRAMSPIADGDRVYVAWGDRTRNRPFGYFAVKLGKDGAVSGMEDITGDMPFPLPVEARVIQDHAGDGGEPALYVGTWGNGLWRLRLTPDNSGG